METLDWVKKGHGQRVHFNAVQLERMRRSISSAGVKNNLYQISSEVYFIQFFTIDIKSLT